MLLATERNKRSKLIKFPNHFLQKKHQTMWKVNISKYIRKPEQLEFQPRVKKKYGAY